jgi:hypothetical protein
MRSDKGRPKQQRSQQVDKGPSETIEHVAYPSILIPPYREGVIRL